MPQNRISTEDKTSLSDLEKEWNINPLVPVDILKSEEFDECKLSVSVYREDLNHPFLQGNKWHKIKGFILKVIANDLPGFASMGGAYSNHLQAVAWAAQQLRKRCVLWIRGEESEWNENPAIQNLRRLGAELHSVSRAGFRQFYSDPGYQAEKLRNFQGLQWVPMGGSSSDCLPYVADWGETIRNRCAFDYLVLPVATSGTVTGLSLSLSPTQTLVAIEVLKAGDTLLLESNRFLKESGLGSVTPIHWVEGYHFGGYAHKNQELTAFCRRINTENGFQIEPVYSAKAFWSVSDLARKGYFPEGSRILIVHTGGLFPWTVQSNEPV